MRTVVANAVVPVGWPPLSEALAKVVAKKIPIRCLRGVREGPWGPRIGSRGEERDVCEPGHLRRARAVVTDKVLTE